MSDAEFVEDTETCDDSITEAELAALRVVAYADHKTRSNGRAGGPLRAFCACGMPHSGGGSPLCGLLRKLING
jgi:hypothetical protein